MNSKAGNRMSGSDLSDLSRFRVPAVRHLAWMSQAPQLICDPRVFVPKTYLTDDSISILQYWEKNPAAGPKALTATPHYRLGHYFESLYECLIQDLLGWTILARNLPIRVGGQTLGELDFVLRNPHTRAIEHHEIAVKFYLAYGGSAQLAAGWYGPNPRDRLDIKTARMLEKQSRRAQLPATSELLKQLGIPLPEVSRVFMPGYLFYPRESGRLQKRDGTPPYNVPFDHLHGHWLYLDDVADLDSKAWVALPKPHWLGPWAQEKAPDDTVMQKTLTEIADTKTPRLFALLKEDNSSGLWKEQDRVFVVPADWPGRSSD
jgi:uncharacterized protein